MEQQYAHNFRMLDQFEFDYQAQEGMITYLNDQVSRLTFGYYVAQLFQGWVPVGIVLFGLLIGVMLYWVKRRALS